MTSIAVVIATFGDESVWGPLAERAIRSAEWQMIDDPDIGRGYVWLHDVDLRTARNAAAEQAIANGATHLVFLDADDELAVGYLNAMHASLRAHPDPALHRPNTIGVYPDGTTDPEPCMIPRTDMRTSNCAVIGTMCPADLFTDVGGFDDYPHLEDWALWRKMLRAGAALVDAPDAIYRVHVRPESRNAPGASMNDTYRRIRREVPV